MIYAETKILRENFGNLLKQSRDLLDLAEGEKRELTTEEQTAYDTQNEDMTKLERKITDIEALLVREQTQAEQVAKLAEDRAVSTDEVVDEKEQVRSNYVQWIRFGYAHENQRGVTPDQVAFNNTRAQNIGTGSEGGFTGAQEFSGEITAALLAFGGVREAARVLPSATGNQMDWPIYDDTSNTGELLSESGAESEQDMVFQNKTLLAYKYSSKTVKASIELLQDSFFNFENDILKPALTERLGRITNTHFTTGDGTNKPNGVVTAATSGLTTASGVAITATELIELIHSVDPAYRTGPKVRFMFNDSTLKAIRSLKDTTNQFIYKAGLTESEPATLLGFPYTINQQMASIAVTTKPVLFGDFNHYIVRDVMALDFTRLNELYAANHQVGFVAIMRTDADLMSVAGPIKYMTMANT